MGIDTCPDCGRTVKNITKQSTRTSSGTKDKKFGNCQKHGRVEVRVVGARGHIAGPLPRWIKHLPKKGL